MDTLAEIWQQIRSTQPAPGPWATWLTLAAACTLLLPRQVWPITRNLITVAHEGGHALAAWCCGRRLAGIQLHSDTSGVTVSAGHPTGPGMVLTAFAGYVAPALFGLGAAALLAHGRILATLWALTLLLALMLLLIRNLYGGLVVLITGAAVFAVSWWTPPVIQTGFVSLLTWFLLLASPRPVYELHLKRRAGEAPTSDADQLAALTGIPGLAWTFLFALVTLGSLLFGAKLLLL